MSAGDDSVRAVYDATAERYAQWAGTVISPATETAFDRAQLRAFADRVAETVAETVATAPVPPGRVVDIGCGPGRAAAFLAGCGLDVVGIDLSPAMVEVARASHPGIPFEVGSLTDLPLDEASVAGAVCWYSIIHTAPGALGGVFAELARVAAAGAPVLVAFQAGDGGAVDRPDAHGTGITLTSYRHSPDDVAATLAAAGFDVEARAVREPELPHETTPQAFLFARRANRNAA